MDMIENEKEWRGGVYLCTASTSFEADILESKLRGENIPSLRRYKGPSNAMEIIMGSSFGFPIEIYVPERCRQDALNIIEAIPLEECEPVDFGDE